MCWNRDVNIDPSVQLELTSLTLQMLSNELSGISLMRLNNFKWLRIRAWLHLLWMEPDSKTWKPNDNVNLNENVILLW